METHHATKFQDVSQDYKIYTTIAVLMFFLVSTTLVRMFTRIVYQGKLTIDDYFIVLGTCFNVIADGMEIFAVLKGFGRHSVFIHIDSLVSALKYMQLGVLMASLAILSIKVSVCFFLLGLIRDTHRRFRFFLWALMVFTTLSTFVGLLLWGLQAHPIERLWDPRVNGTRRSSRSFLNVVYVFYAFNAFTDLVYSLSPVWFLWTIQIPKKKKYSIFAVMGSGLILTGVVCLCIYFAPEFLETEDITWALVPIFITDCTQRHLSGIVANMPALYMLFSRTQSDKSSTNSSRLTKIWRSLTRSNNNASGSALDRSIVIETDIRVKGGERANQGRDPYPLETEHEDDIPLKERGFGPAGTRTENIDMEQGFR